MSSTADLVALLDRLLGPGSEEVVPATSTARLGLALDHADLEDPQRFDAVVLHRSYGFEPPPGLGVVACHDPFDRALGLAHNTRLHAALGLTRSTLLAEKATWHAAPVDVLDRLRREFGGFEVTHGSLTATEAVVLADAMNERLVRDAAQWGARLYVTGTWRPSAAAAVDVANMDVVVVGHARQERHALRTLARLLETNGYSPDACMR